VDEGRHGRRSGHRIRQPDIERNLRGLPHRPEKEAQADERHVRRVLRRVGGGGPEDFAEVHAPEEREDPADAEDEAEVPDAVHDERLLARVRGELLVVVVPDQQIRAESHSLPPHEHQEEVVREHEDEHRKHEEVQVGEVTTVTRVVTHVADGIDVDEESDEGDERDHERGQ
jgi:hypothetical protein